MTSGDGSAATTALIGGKVIDGTGSPARAATVLVRGERIVSVGLEVRVPRGAAVIDVSGQYILPGLIDMHGHMYARATAEMRSQFAAYPKLFLAGGVTTVRSPGDFEPEGMVALRDRIAAGREAGPRIFTAGPYFDHAPSQVEWIRGTTTAEEALELFNQWKGRIDSIKLYTRITEPQFVAVLNAAHAAGLPATGHLDSITATRAIELGIDGLEHGIFAMSELVADRKEGESGRCALARLDLDSPLVTQLIANIVKHRVVIDPTIVVFQIFHPDFQPLTPNWTDYLSEEARAHQLQMQPRLPLTREAQASAACLSRALEKQLGFVRKVHEAGGLVIAGTDPVSPRVLPGYGLQRELKNLVDAGLTPVEAIKAATHDAATALQREHDFGTIAPRMRADLVVVSGDVEHDIRAVGNTEMVFKDGVRYEPAALRKAAEGQIH